MLLWCIYSLNSLLKKIPVNIKFVGETVVVSEVLVYVMTFVLVDVGEVTVVAFVALEILVLVTVEATVPGIVVVTKLEPLVLGIVLSWVVIVTVVVGILLAIVTLTVTLETSLVTDELIVVEALVAKLVKYEDSVAVVIKDGVETVVSTLVSKQKKI